MFDWGFGKMEFYQSGSDWINKSFLFCALPFAGFAQKWSFRNLLTTNRLTSDLPLMSGV
ncbi:hypothetical protein SAMN02745166_04036 [Prosthecobacter debontii]|uniref:Uncharacterized protein n=1 Tax=Prosthecobacter debontii TaxID=48467 RepID=A0A1T4YR51_9BACT|nr:hypothetical protein SAMN02745166_04036 [Prosthecobacter debontii]